MRRGGDVLSPLINLGWLALAVLAAWCLGRVWNAGAAAVAATAVVATTPVMIYASAGSAGNDLAGIALLLAAAALVVRGAASPRVAGLAGLAAGLAVGTKLTLIAPVIALTAVLAVAWVRERAPRAAPSGSAPSSRQVASGISATPFAPTTRFRGSSSPSGHGRCSRRRRRCRRTAAPRASPTD